MPRAVMAPCARDLATHFIPFFHMRHREPVQVDTEQNVVLISIASVADPSLAPAGKHTLHAYLPATEPFDRWQGLERGGAAYEALKEERSQVRIQPAHSCYAA